MDRNPKVISLTKIIILLVFTISAQIWINSCPIDKEYPEPEQNATLNISRNLSIARSNIDASFLEDEAGISLYTDVNMILDLSTAASAFKIIEQQTSDYIVGIIDLANNPESDNVHCYIHKEGYIFVYYLKQDPVSRIIDWNYVIEGAMISDKLYLGLMNICTVLEAIPSNLDYYHFQYPFANKFTLVLDIAEDCPYEEITSLLIPNDFYYFEKSWSHRHNDLIIYEKFTYSQFIPDVTHLIKTEIAFGWDWWVSDYSKFSIDEEEINCWSGSFYCGEKIGGGIVLAYSDQSTSAKMTVQNADVFKTIDLSPPRFFSNFQPLIIVNTPNGTNYNTLPSIDVDFIGNMAKLANAYYKIDNFEPVGTDISGWIPIFTTIGSTSFTSDFLIDETLWNSLSDGSHNIYFKVWDELDFLNDGSNPSLQFFKVHTNPIIDVNMDNGIYFDSAPIMDVDFSGSGYLQNAYYKIDSFFPTGTTTTDWIPIFINYGSYNFNSNFMMDNAVWNTLGDGSHVVYFKVWDDADYINDGSSPSWQFYKDTDLIHISVNMPDGSYYNSSPIMDVDFSCSFSNLKDAFYKINSFEPNGKDTTGWLPVFTDLGDNVYSNDFKINESLWSSLNNEYHIVYFKAWDDLNNISEGPLHDWQFFKDVEEPSIIIDIPGEKYFSISPLLNIEILDNGMLKDIYYKIDSPYSGGINTTGWMPIYTDLSNSSIISIFKIDNVIWDSLSIGSHILYFKATDRAGNINEGLSQFWEFYKLFSEGTDENEEKSDKSKNEQIQDNTIDIESIILSLRFIWIILGIIASIVTIRSRLKKSKY